MSVVRAALILLSLITLFLSSIFYIYTVTHYSGGNSYNSEAVKYSFRYNYFCDLLHGRGYNRQEQDTRSSAFSFLFLFGLSFALLWFYMANWGTENMFVRLLANLAGLALVSFPLMLSRFHDPSLFVLMALGFFVFVYTLVSLLKVGMGPLALYTSIFFLWGVLTFVLWAKGYEGSLLPTFQSILLALAGGWILTMNLQLALKFH